MSIYECGNWKMFGRTRGRRRGRGWRRMPKLFAF